MNRILFDYSLKNIGVPSKDTYRLCLIEKVESVVTRMRWKADFFLNGQSKYERNNFGLKSKKSPPPVKEMKGFEEDLVLMVERLRFREVHDPFLTKINNDLKKVNSSTNMYILAVKTRTLYETTPDQYDKILKDNITKSYKLGETNMLNNVNEDLRYIVIELSIDNRIETMAKREASVTAKDHKENFEDNPKFRLINRAKSELGKVSKIILDEINNNIRERTGVNQWRNSQSVIDWFKTINEKPNHIFISIDITNFFPSITEQLLDKAIRWARTITPITDQQEKIIKHARTSFLFSNRIYTDKTKL